MKDLILAHDLGTSGNKACLYTAEGKLVASSTAAYDTFYLPGGGVEQDPQDWWEAVAGTTREVCACVSAERIGAVCFSAQMMGLVCVDRDARPLYRSLIHSDQRAYLENRTLQSKLDERSFFRITGHRMGPSFPLQKLMWLKKNEPEIYNKTWKVINAKDYIVFRMTGNCMTDFTDASSTDMFDITKREWSEELCGIAGIDMSKLPETYPSTHIAGGLISEAAAQLGLEAGIPVVLGAGDGMCSSVGCGAIRPGKVYNYIGSSAWITGIMEEPPMGENMYLESWAHPAGPWANAGGTMQSAGASYEWASKTLYGKADQAAMDKELERTKPGAGGVLFLPYLNGERVPFWNEKARGTFVGIHAQTTSADLLRAVLEGIAFNLKIIFDEVKNWMEVKDIVLLGGAAGNPLLCQILADVYGVPAVTLKNTGQITSLGAAIIGGVGTGMIDSFDSAQQFCEIGERFLPDPENSAYYQSRSCLLPDCYHALTGIFERLASQ